MKTSSLNRSVVALAAALLFAGAAAPVFAQSTDQNTGGNSATTQSASNDTSQSATGQSAKTAKTTQSTDQSSDGQQLSAHDQEVVKLSNEGLSAMQAVHAARIAIFDSNPKMAEQLLNKAQSSLTAASKDATTLKGETKTANNGSSNSGSSNNASSDQSANSTKTADNGSKGADNKADYVAIDGRMSMADGFVVTPTSNSNDNGQDAKGGQTTAQSNKDDANVNVQLAAVDATFTRLMMPLQTTTQHVDAAVKLVSQQKYYEANQALKAAEEGLVIDVVALEGVPTGSPQKGGDNHAKSSSQSQGQSQGQGQQSQSKG